MDQARAHHHAVKFYGTADELLDTVGHFVSDGLVAAQPVVVIASVAHHKQIRASLVARSIDVDLATSAGDLVLLDAHEMLDALMVDEMPDGALFRKVATGLIEQALRGRERTHVRVYGELVDILWKQERTDAAVRLELLWNELATTHDLLLLCAYAIAHFYEETASYQAVCQLHTHVHEHERAGKTG